MSALVYLSDLRALLKESVIEAKITDSGIFINKIKPRENYEESLKINIKKLSKLPFHEFSKIASTYNFKVDKDVVFNDEEMMLISRISHNPDVAVFTKLDTKDKNKIIVVIERVNATIISEKNASNQIA